MRQSNFAGLSGRVLLPLVLAHQVACSTPPEAAHAGPAPAAPAASATPVAAPIEPVAPTAPVARAVRSGLESSLESVSLAALRADVYFLASDLLAGRDTPSPGLEIAAHYIRARLERLGWEPGAADGYFYSYPLNRTRLDFEASRATATVAGQARPLVLGDDYFLGSPQDGFDSKVAGELVWCGGGAPEDLTQAALEGAWAVCEQGGGTVNALMRSLREAKAAGLVIVEPRQPKQSFVEAYGKMDSLRRGRVSYPSDGNDEAASRRGPRLPRVYLARAAFDRLASAAGLDLQKLQAGQKLAIQFEETRAMDAAGQVDVHNVCGLWPGSDPQLKNEVIILSAHYDHVGTQGGEIHNGADDNASGTSGLLAVAEALRARGPLRRTVMLMWLSGEEKGLWGSKAWNDKPWLPEGARAVANLNIDMIGRNAPDKLLVTPTAKRKEHNGLVRLAESFSALEGFPRLDSADEYYSRSDHYNFAKKGIPAAFLFSDVHEDYHQPGDDPEKIDYDKMRRVVRLVLRMLDGLQQDELGI